MTIVDILESINPVLWVLTNLLLMYVGVALLFFVMAYQVLFDPRATTGGRMIFRFALSLGLVVSVIVVGIFVDPIYDIPWHAYPGDTIWWRPIVRLGAYAYVAYTITALIIFLWKRKFRPERLRTAPDKLLVKPRHDTAEIPTIKENNND